MMSVTVEADRQGSLQGVVASQTGLSTVVTPLLMPWLFSAFSLGVAGIRFPGAPYLLGAVLGLVGMALLARRAGVPPFPVGTKAERGVGE
jgi:DHA1 family tetracycline resistance protein-like MFS transporter